MAKIAALELYRVGSKVKLNKDVNGTIIGIHISGNSNVVYECSWWDANSYYQGNFSPEDIEVTLSEKFKIGFAT